MSVMKSYTHLKLLTFYVVYGTTEIQTWQAVSEMCKIISDSVKTYTFANRLCTLGRKSGCYELLWNSL